MASRRSYRPTSLDKKLAVRADINMSQTNHASNQASPEKKEPNSSRGSPSKNGILYAFQDQLPKLPIPDLDSTCTKYLSALHPLQSPKENQETKAAVKEFLRSEGPELQEKLKKYANGRANYIEQFCMFPFQDFCTELMRCRV
jgi:carnitine O-acetyltransferase